LNKLLLSTVFVEMLKNMEHVFRDFGIDYYLVGAVARDIHLSVCIEAEALRKTEDIDIAKTINDAGQYNELKKALISTGDFTADPTEAIKLYYKSVIELDLLPFGAIESINRTVNLIDPTFILNMPGFKEIYPFVNDIKVENTFTVKVCTMEGIILLKLLANNDRPQRTKDILDIEHIINVYFDLYSGNIYDEHFDIMDSYKSDQSDYLQLVSSRVIGRKIKRLLEGSDELSQRVEQILANRPTAWWQAMLDGIKDKL
jgi:predicted nucleotidyltransferase